ncbi:hypothetical protein JW964_25650 [candidate division KSB1 bacterium]|nr:hypothetical protein [candidate division KSB1 bacterium]
MEENFRIIGSKLLAVEGKDECQFFEALLKFEKIDGVQTLDVGGKNKFRTELPLLMNMEGFRNVTALGFVRDAEEKMAISAFQSICDTLQKYNLPTPPSPNAINSTHKPATGIFIMPDNYGTGMLENLCLKTIAGTLVESCINQFQACFLPLMPPAEQEKFNEPKSRVQSYLATRSPFANSPGLAALKGYWDFNHVCFEEIKGFLHQLFDSE